MAQRENKDFFSNKFVKEIEVPVTQTNSVQNWLKA